MKVLDIKVGPLAFKAIMEIENAPKTCERFETLLPFNNQVIHSRWSGEAVWIPLGDFDMGLDFENHTSHGSKGDLLLYPGGFSETEILFVYGSSRFASKMGQLAGNHFLTIIEGREHLEAMGKLVLWQGAQDVTVRASP
jgi:hypothetical protein